MSGVTRKDQLESIINTLTEGVLIINTSGIITFANSSAEKILGRKRDELIGRSYSNPGYKVTTTDRKDYPVEERPITKALQTGTSVLNAEYAVERPDGSWITISVNVNPLRNEKGAIEAVVLSFANITGRKKVEEELQAGEKKLRDITSVLGEGVYVLDKKGHLTFLNPEGELLLGWSEEELLGKDVHEAIHCKRADGTKMPAEECPVLEITNSGGVYRTDDDVFTRKDGSMFPVAYVTTPIIENGKVVASVTTFQDITERKQIEKLNAALAAINTSITSTLDFDEIMQRVVVESAQAIGCETSALALRKEGKWSVTYVYRFPDESIGQSFSREEIPFVELAAKTKDTVVIDDAYNDPRVNLQMQKRFNVRSVMVIPLVVREETIGVLFFNYHTTTHVFTDAQVDFANKLAVSVSLALENSRLYSAEREIAETLQEALLRMPERIAGIGYGRLYHSATEAAKVGGDFYDIFELANEKVGIVMGDVSGKGLKAATLTSLVKNSIRAYSLEGYTPAQVMQKTNDLLIEASPSSLFITVFLGILDTKTGTLRYCSAGHPPALLKRGADEVELLSTSSPMVGAFEEFDYQDESATLRGDDVLIVYTDGVIEARCGGEFFGEKRLIDLVRDAKTARTEEIPQLIFNKVIELTGGNLLDDIAILTISLGEKLHV